MRFKPKIKGILMKAPILIILAFVCMVGHPVRAEAASSIPVLKYGEDGMDSFSSYNGQYVTYTSGKKLKKMFPSGTSKLKDDAEYYAYIKIDKEKSSGVYWSTVVEYWHTAKWGTSVPRESDAQQRADLVYQSDVKSSDKRQGKASGYSYYLSVGGAKQTVPRGRIATLHYISTSIPDFENKIRTELEKALNSSDNISDAKLEEMKTVTFYISPIIKASDRSYNYYDLNSWRGHGWGDTSTFASHYDVPVKLQPPTSKLSVGAYIVGGKKTDSSSVKNQAGAPRGNASRKKDLLTKESSTAADISSSDYLWEPDKDMLLTDKNGKNYSYTKYN